MAKLSDRPAITSIVGTDLIYVTSGGASYKGTVNQIPVAQSQVAGLGSALSTLAPLASPALSGTPTAPTATAGTNTTQVATTAFTRGEIAALVNSAPTLLDTLGEIATQLASEESVAAALATTVAGKASSAALATHIGDTTNPHAVTKAQIGLGSVDNTADAAKPVSATQQASINLAALADPGAVIRAAPGLLADYEFRDGSGLVAADSSGNARPMTLTGVTWEQGGVKFGANQYGTLPTTVRNAYRTFYVLTGRPDGTGIVYLLSDMAGTLTVRAQRIYDGSEVRPFDGSGTISFLSAPYPLVLAWSFPDSAPASVAVNGRSPASYAGRGVHPAIDRTGNHTVGAYAPNPAAGYPAVVWGVAFYSEVHTPAQMSAVSRAMADRASDRVAIGSGPVDPGSVALFLGDSRATALSVSPSDIPTTRAYTRINYGQPGKNTADVAAYAADAAALARPAAVRNLAVVWAGVNDAQLEASYDPEATWGRLRKVGRTLRAAGWEVLVCTEISATVANWESGTGMKSALNARILATGSAGWAGAFDGVVRFDQTTLGADGAAADTTLFADGLHPTAAGRAVLQAALSTAIDAIG